MKKILLSILIIAIYSHVLAETKTTDVGVIVPLAYDFENYGKAVKRGIDKSYNPEVHYLYEDEQCNPQVAAAAFRNLQELESVDYFLGPWCGSSQATVAPLIKAEEKVAILGSSAPRRLFKMSGNRMFSTQHSVEDESIFNAQQIAQMGYKSVVIMFLDNDFSRVHEAAFRSAYPGKILDTMIYTSASDLVIKPMVAKIRALQPEALYVPDAYPFFQGLMRELRNRGLRDLPVFSIHTADSSGVIEASGRNGDGLIISYPDIGEQDPLIYFPKVAADILGKAIRYCEDDGPKCVLRAIKRQNSFDKYGVLKGRLGLKILNEGRFEWYKNNIKD